MRVLVRPVGQGPGQHRRQVAGAEADQRVVAVEASSRRPRRPRPRATGSPVPGPHDLDDHALVEHQALARRGLVGDEAEVGGAVALVGVDAARARASRAAPAETPRRRPSAFFSDGSATPSSSAFSSDAASGSSACRCSRRAAGRPSPGPACSVWPVPAGKDGAADRVRAGLHHRAGGREVIAEAVVDQVAGAKAGGEQRARPCASSRAARLRARRSARASEHAQRAPPARAAPQPTAAKPPNGSSAPRRSAARAVRACAVTGSAASAARDVIAAASTPAQRLANAGAFALRVATCAGSARHQRRPRARLGSRVSRSSSVGESSAVSASLVVEPARRAASLRRRACAARPASPARSGRSRCRRASSVRRAGRRPRRGSG